MKRALALAAAAVTIAALAACSAATDSPTIDTPTIDLATSAPPAAEVLTETAPLPVEEYVAEFSATRGWLSSLDEVNEEYRAAAAAFPLELPEGFAWPTETWIADDGQGGVWQQGNGVGQAYFYWEMATSTAAFADHMRGDDRAAAEHLAALEDGRSGTVAAMFIEDPEGGFVSSAVAPARAGDWTPLYEQNVQPFLAHPTYAALAAQAGDLVVP